MNKKILVLGALLCAMAVTGCENTWHGMGRDTEKVGEEMQNQYN
jgi:predicted small secreted protein